MTLESEYIKKFNFDCQNFSDSITFYIQQEAFLYYIKVIYTSPNNKYDTIELSLYNIDKIHIESKITEFNKDYNIIFPIMLNIIHNFTEVLNKNPLILIDYLKEKQIQQCKENKIIHFDACKLYNLIINSKKELHSFLKNLAHNKSYPIHFIQTITCSDNQFFYFSKRTFKLKFQDNFYYFFFTNKNYIRLSFENALIFLTYFHCEDEFDIFNQLGSKKDLKNTYNLILTVYNNEGNIVSNHSIEQFLLNIEIENF